MFRMTADGVFNGFADVIRRLGYVELQPIGVESAQVVVYNAPYWITTNGTDRPHKPIITKLALMQYANEMETVTREELRQFFAFVQDHYTGTNYRTVKNSPLWREVYGVRQKHFDTYDSGTNVKGTTVEDATYCQRCTLILPLRNLTIDHQKPQQNGRTEAMLRVFRAAGLTITTGYGQKNRFLQRHFAPLIGGQTTVRARGDRGNPMERDTLSAKGVIFFTALHHYDMVEELMDMTMHHIVNLRPMCGPCNSSLRNTNLTWI